MRLDGGNTYHHRRHQSMVSGPRRTVKTQKAAWRQPPAGTIVESIQVMVTSSWRTSDFAALPSARSFRFLSQTPQSAFSRPVTIGTTVRCTSEAFKGMTMSVKVLENSYAIDCLSNHGPSSRSNFWRNFGLVLTVLAHRHLWLS